MFDGRDQLAFIGFLECLMKPNQNVLWTAHRHFNVQATFEKLRGITVMPVVAPHISRVSRAKGQERIEFKNGSRMVFVARCSGAGRGFSNIDKLVLDEDELLTDDMRAELVPTQCGAANPETIRINHGVASHST